MMTHPRANIDALLWDVDLLAPDPIRAFGAESPTLPRVFGRSETADAEPAVPGWRFPVDELCG